MMETINDIVRKVAEEMLNTSMQEITAGVIKGWAVRLGDAATCKESLQVGNMAEMRVALNAVIDSCDTMLKMKRDAEFVEKWAVSVRNIVGKALKCPPRNCDLLSNAQDALSAIYNDRGYVQNPIEERKLTVEWLFAETKGETK
jgi:hypothetical protein